VIDLDALRALCKSDVRTQRAILANRKEREDLDRELSDLQCKPVLRGSPVEQEMEARRDTLHARFEELLRPKDDDDVDEPEGFDAEAEYERVMGSKAVTPHIPGEHRDVQFIPRKDSMATPTVPFDIPATEVSSCSSEEVAHRKRKAEGYQLDDDNDDDPCTEVEREWTSAEDLAWRRGYRRLSQKRGYRRNEPDLQLYASDEKEGWIVPKLYYQIERNRTQYGTVGFWFDDDFPNMRKWVAQMRRWGPSCVPEMDVDDMWEDMLEEKYGFERDGASREVV
jgi:hypothetical protein